MDRKKRSFYVWLTTLCLSVLILLITVFSNWFGVSMWGFSENTTLLKVAKLASEFNDYFGGDSNALGLAAAVIYAVLVIMAIGAFLTLRSLHDARTNGEEISKSLFITAIILAILVIVIVAISNISVNKEAEGWLKDIFHLTSAPFFVLAFGVAGYVVNTKYWVERFDFSDISGGSIHNKAPVVESGKELYCPKCKKTVFDSGKFCSTCGTELVSATIPCPRCGKSVAYDAAFCSNCGCDITKHSKENDDYICDCGAHIKRELIRENRLKFCPQCGKEVKVAPKPVPIADGDYVCECGTKISNPYLKYCPQCGKEIKRNRSQPPVQQPKDVSPASGHYRVPTSDDL